MCRTWRVENGHKPEVAEVVEGVTLKLLHQLELTLGGSVCKGVPNVHGSQSSLPSIVDSVEQNHPKDLKSPTQKKKHLSMDLWTHHHQPEDWDIMRGGRQRRFFPTATQVVFLHIRLKV